jgi:phosphoenolpyruvate-protein kinase (PTS system EI component)
MQEIIVQPISPGRAVGKICLSPAAEMAGNVVALSNPSLAELRRLEIDRPAAIVVVGSSPTSHVVIHAAGLGIPVVRTKDSPEWLRQGSILAVDGTTGEVLIAPGPDLQASWQRGLPGTWGSRDDPPVQHVSNDPLRSRDGLQVEIGASLSGHCGGEIARASGAAGIYLVRTEFLGGVDELQNSSDHHYLALREVMERARGLQATIRLLDIGAEKQLHEASQSSSFDVLGLRGARHYKNCGFRDIIENQLAAIERISSEHCIRLLVPFVTSVDEFVELCDYLQLRKRFPGIEIGAMVEVPSMCYQIEALAQEVDFAAVGLNDLCQLFFAADRTLEAVSAYADPYGPAFHRLLRATAELAQDSSLELCVCGRAVTFPGIMELLLGHGFRRFSVLPTAISPLRRLVQDTSIEFCQELSMRVACSQVSADVRSFVETRLW